MPDSDTEAGPTPARRAARAVASTAPWSIARKACWLPAAAMAASGQLYCEPFPFKTPTLDLSMVWLSHVDTDPAERWMRSRLEAFMSERDMLPVVASKS